LSGQSQAAGFAVVKTVADPPGSNADTGGLFKVGSQGGANGSNHFPWTDSNIYDDFGSTVRKTVGNPSPALTSWRILSFHSKGSDWRCYIDDGAVFSFTTATNTAGFTSTPKIGTSTNGVSPVYANMWVAEIVLTNDFLTDADRNKVAGYLAWRHAITANLAVGHTYKSAPP
jgi:hypothetical protein